LFEEELGIWGNVLVLAASLGILAEASDVTSAREREGAVLLSVYSLFIATSFTS
jgi:hypothetical protein